MNDIITNGLWCDYVRKNYEGSGDPQQERQFLSPFCVKNNVKYQIKSLYFIL